MNEQIPQPQSRKKIDLGGQISSSMREKDNSHPNTDYLIQAKSVEFDSFFSRLQRMVVAWLNHSSGLALSHPVEKLIYTLELDKNLDLNSEGHPHLQPSEWLLGELVQMTFRLQDESLDETKAQKIRHDLTHILNTYDSFVYEQRNQSHIDWQRVDQESVSLKPATPPVIPLAKWRASLKNLLNRF